MRAIEREGYTFYHGQHFTAKIKGMKVEGMVSLETDLAPILCQDIKSDGSESAFGYWFGWSVEDGVWYNDVTDLVLYDMSELRYDVY